MSGAVEEKTKRGSKCLLTLFLRGHGVNQGRHLCLTCTRTHTKKKPPSGEALAVCVRALTEPNNHPAALNPGGPAHVVHPADAGRWTRREGKNVFPVVSARRHSGSRGKTNARRKRYTEQLNRSKGHRICHSAQHRLRLSRKEMRNGGDISQLGERDD